MTTLTLPSETTREAQRRRTFAIISHPDAGKTTLTEKLLLYANAIDLAGAVKAKKNQRSANSFGAFASILSTKVSQNARSIFAARTRSGCPTQSSGQLHNNSASCS